VESVNPQAGAAALPVIEGPAWRGTRCFCTTRAGGVGRAPFDTLNLGLRAGDDPQAVHENRRRLRAMLPAEPLWLAQVHGARVVDADIPNDTLEADAAVTAMPGRVLAIMAADCLPVAIADTRGRVLGAAHAGWRGLSAGVLECTLQRLRSRCPDGRWTAWIGPGIGPARFEVGEDVLRAFAGPDPDAAAAFAPFPGRPGKWLADLPRLAERRLRAAGVADVHASGLCTAGDPERFFSYRRDGVTGRMAMLAWLTGDSPD